MDDTLIKVEDLCKIYNPGENEVRALDDVSFYIQRGEFVAIIGPSGSGKSTLLHILGGVDRPTSGRVYLDGIDVYGQNEEQLAIFRRREVGLIYQFYNLIPVLNVVENMTLPVQMDGRKVGEERLQELLKLLSLEDRKNHLPNQLSGGQQQRVALARALVLEPGVLLFDEPLSNLDAKLRVDMRNEIRRIQQQAGITAIYVTHDQSEAMALSDNIIIMKKGVVDQIGDPHTVYYHPVDEFVADFIGESNFLRGSISKKDGESGLATIEGHEVEVASIGHLSEGDKCVLVLRPESAQLAEEGVLPCKVTLSRFMGNYQNYQVMVGDTLVKITDFNPKNHKIFEVGDEAFVKFGKEDVHVL